jgi:hypothetical protein
MLPKKKKEPVNSYGLKLTQTLNAMRIGIAKEVQKSGIPALWSRLK